MMGPEAVLALFPNKEECMKNVNTIIVISLIPDLFHELIDETKDTVMPELTAILSARDKLSGMIAGQEFEHLKEILTDFISDFKFTSPMSSLHDEQQHKPNSVPESVTFSQGDKSKAKPRLSTEQREQYLATLNDITDCLSNDKDVRNYTKISNVAKALKSQIEGDMADDNSIDSGVTTETSSRTSYSSTIRSTKLTRSTRSRATNKSARTHGSLSSYSSSIFTTDKDCKIKTRAKFSEKIIWDGRRTAFTALSNLIMGHLHQVNASYMVNPSFLKRYINEGSKYLKSPKFTSRFGVNYNQALYDRKYLFGILQTVTRAGGAGYKHVLKHLKRTDGFKAWKDMANDAAYDGSKNVKISKLKAIIHKPYSTNIQGGLVAFVDTFQTSIEELGTLHLSYAPDTFKRDLLIDTLRPLPECVYMVDHITDNHLDFSAACAYLREKALFSGMHQSSGRRKFHKVVTEDESVHEDTSEDNVTKVFTTVTQLASETGQSLSQVFSTMTASPTLRESMRIPDALWDKLSVEIKKEINKIRRKARTTSTSMQKTLPKQYTARQCLIDLQNFCH